jgi:hypothetical protein
MRRNLAVKCKVTQKQQETIALASLIPILGLHEISFIERIYKLLQVKTLFCQIKKNYLLSLQLRI